MTEAEYIVEIRNRIYETGTVLNDTFELICAAFKEHSNSPSLWCLRGDMIQLSDEEIGCTLNDVLRATKRHSI